MSASGLLHDLASRGVVLAAEGDRLRWRAPAGVLSPADRTAIVEHKAGLLELLALEAAHRSYLLAGDVAGALVVAGWKQTGVAACARCRQGTAWLDARGVPMHPRCGWTVANEARVLTGKRFEGRGEVRKPSPGDAKKNCPRCPMPAPEPSQSAIPCGANGIGGAGARAAVSELSHDDGGVPPPSPIGATDNEGIAVEGKSYLPGDVWATVARALGIPLDIVHTSKLGRPMKIANGGVPIKDLIS